MHATPLPIDLVEPDAPAPVGDRFPCHLFAPEVCWPVPPEAVLRADKPAITFPVTAAQAHIDDGLARRRDRGLAPITTGIAVASLVFIALFLLVDVITRRLAP